MKMLRTKGLGFIPDGVPYIFTEKGAVHKSIFYQLQGEYEDGQALQVRWLGQVYAAGNTAAAHHLLASLAAGGFGDAGWASLT